MNRRQLLVRAVALAAVPLSGPTRAAVESLAGRGGEYPGPAPSVSGGASEAGEVTYLGAGSVSKSAHFLLGLDARHRVRYRIPVPGRGHGISWHPAGGLAVAVARRPGRWLLVFDTRDGRVVSRAQAPEGRHFQGHAVFSDDGTRIMVSTNDLVRERGAISVYGLDHAGPRWLGEWDSGGVGPHEILALPGDRLAVCNGGLLTRPESGRRVLNLDTMHSNLSVLDATDGALLRSHVLDERWRLASIRHMSLLAGGDIAVGMQFQGDSRGESPLVALARPNSESLTPLWAPDGEQRALKDYCGSVRASADGESFAITSPRGNRAQAWSRTGTLLEVTKLRDVCGIAARAEGGWVLSDGLGRSHEWVPGSPPRTLVEAGEGSIAHWDNHLGNNSPGG
ncbi:MAG: DUF1513 domain-containing protein [Gammaproteobacteria bacterium]